MVSFIVLKKVSSCNNMPPAETSDQQIIVEEESKSSWSVTGNFSQFKYWTLDTPPTPDDNFMSTMKWITTAQCVCVCFGGFA